MGGSPLAGNPASGLHCSRGEIEVDAAAQVPPSGTRRQGKDVSSKENAAPRR